MDDEYNFLDDYKDIDEIEDKLWLGNSFLQEISKI